MNKRKFLTIPLLAVLISSVCILCWLIPTVIVLQLAWNDVVQRSSLNEFAPRSSYLRSGLTAEIEAASRNLLESVGRFDLIANVHKSIVQMYFDHSHNVTNVSHLPYVQLLGLELVAPVFEQEKLRPHSFSIFFNDLSGVMISFPNKPSASSTASVNTVSSTVLTYLDTAATTTSLSGATTATPGINFSFTDYAATAKSISTSVNYRSSKGSSNGATSTPSTSVPLYPQPVVNLGIDVTPNRGYFVLDITKNTSIALASILGISPALHSSKSSLNDFRPITWSNKFDRDQFDKLLAYFGPPTPNSWVLLEYDGLILGSYVPPSDLGLLSEVGPLALQLAVAKPLRTPSGYNCFVDASGSRFASCMLLISALPIYSAYARQHLGTAAEPSTIKFNGKKYCAATMELTSTTGMWSLTNLKLHVFSPENDLNPQRHQLAPVMYPIAFGISAFVLFVIFILSKLRLQRRLKNLCNVADHVRHWAKSSAAAALSSGYPSRGPTDVNSMLARMPRVTLSAISELRSAQVELVGVTRRLFDLTKTLLWLHHVGSGAGDGGDSSGGDGEGSHQGHDELDPLGDRSPDDRLEIPPAEIDALSEAASFSTSLHCSGTTSTVRGAISSGLDVPTVTRAGKTVNSFLMLHIKSRVLDPTLRAQSVIFSAAFDILQQHNAVVESVKHGIIFASFHSKQHSLRAVECARSMTAALDALAVADSLSDDVKCFIVCHQATALRWGMNDMLTSTLPSALNPNSNSSAHRYAYLPLMSQSSLSSSQQQHFHASPQVVLRGDSYRKAHLCTMGDVIESMLCIGELQRSVLRSRLILSDAVVSALPQRIASVLTPVDYVSLESVSAICAPSGSPTSPSSPAAFNWCVKLYEDPTVECVLRTHFVIACRAKLSIAFDHLIAGELDDAMKAMEDFDADPTAADVCNWHVYRWRRWISVVRGQRGSVGGNMIGSAAPGTDVSTQYLRRLEYIQQDSIGA